MPLKQQTGEVQMTAHERRVRAGRMRMAGMTYQQIADKLGYRNVSGAYRAVATLIKRTEQETAQEFRVLELERLDLLSRGLWDKARGRIARDGTVIKEPDLKAVDRLLQIMKRRAKLLGLDAPTKIAQTDAEGRDADFVIVVQNANPPEGGEEDDANKRPM